MGIEEDSFLLYLHPARRDSIRDLSLRLKFVGEEGSAIFCTMFPIRIIILILH